MRDNMRNMRNNNDDWHDFDLPGVSKEFLKMVALAAVASLLLFWLPLGIIVYLAVTHL